MRIMVIGDSDFASNAAAGIQGNADLFVNMNNWLTQQEDLISIHPRDAGDRRITMTADQQRRHAVAVAADHSRAHSRFGRLHLVAEAINGTRWLDADPARSSRSRLGGYLYFVESERPVADENAKKKVFSYDAAKINQVQVKSSSGEVTALRKDANDTWTIVQPAEAPADRNSVSDVVTNLANLEEERVVDENASDLKAYGLAEPRIDVTFHVDGEKEPKRILLGDKTPASTGIYAKLPSSNRVFLVGTPLDTTLDKSTFDFRDKTALRSNRTR